MEAKEFVKKYGWEKSKSILINAHHKTTHFYCGWMELVDYFYKHENRGWCKVDSRTTGWDSDRCCYDVHPPVSSMFVIDDLKTLVDAYELVEKFGGLFHAKVTLEKEGFTGGIELDGELIEDVVLKQAIDLVGEL